MIKRIPAIFIFTLLAACSTYEVKDAGDGVYYAESPPEYSYVYSSGYGFGWPYWYGSYYYPFYSSCWYAPYVSSYCAWQGTPYFRHAFFAPPYYGDFSVSQKYPVGGSGEQKSRKKRVILPITPENPVSPSLVDARSSKYGTARSYQGAKAVPGKSSYPSTSSAFGKRTMKAPKQSYSRPTRARSSSKSRISSKTTAPRKLD